MIFPENHLVNEGSSRRVDRTLAAVIVSLTLILVLAGCGSSAESAESGGEASPQLDIAGSFYPLVFVAEQVGGEHVTVDNLTPPGAEPHDLELTPREVSGLQEADLIVYLPGFAPALDEALQGVGASQVFDVTLPARLNFEDDDDDGEHESEDHESEEHDEDHESEDHESEEHDEDHESEDHESEEHDEDHESEERDEDHDGGDHDEHDHGGADPHFWLDPTRVADVADATAARLAEIDPENAESFLQNAAALRVRFEALDDDFRKGLADCSRVDLVTSHRAFGYLANRYGLKQVGIAGLSPEQEPSAAQLAEVSDFVRDEQVSVIYYASRVDPGVAQTVADETGAMTDVLDPLETLTESAAGDDYFQVMRSNLKALRRGLDCS